MTSGYQSNGVDLDNIFAPLTTQTPVPNVGYTVAGVDLSQRYAPLSTTPVAVTGYESNGIDLNEIFEPGSSGGFTFKFVNRGTLIPYKQIGTFVSSPLFPSTSVIVISDNYVYQYPGGLWVAGITSDTTGITYESQFTIPNSIENSIDNLWLDLNVNDLPVATQQIASGSYVADSSGTWTLTGLCDTPNPLMTAFISLLASGSSIQVASQDAHGSLIGITSVTTGDTEGLWAAIAAQATAAGLYSGAGGVMIAPVAIATSGDMNTTPPGSSGHLLFGPAESQPWGDIYQGNVGSDLNIIEYWIPTMLIERN